MIQLTPDDVEYLRHRRCTDTQIRKLRYACERLDVDAYREYLQDRHAFLQVLLCEQIDCRFANDGFPYKRKRNKHKKR